MMTTEARPALHPPRQAGHRRPLEGVRVLDLTIAMAGPLAAQRLGDMGADVVKVEAPGSGDLTRVFLLQDIRVAGETTSFLALNRNKRSVCLDLKTAEGLQVLRQLIEGADVFMQNFRPGVVERLGLDYESVAGVNPNIVYCSISGYGDAGPMVGRPGQDLLVQGFSGLMFNAGPGDGPPHPAPVYLIDTTASHLATEAVLAGLVQRQRDGIGQHVKVSLLGAALEMQCQELMTYQQQRKLAARTRAPYASVWLEPPYGVYRTQDGWLALSQNDLSVIADVTGSPALADAAAQRPAHAQRERMKAWRDQVYRALQQALLPQCTAHWVEALGARGVWCGVVQDYEQLLAHPQAQPFFTRMRCHDGSEVDAVAPAIAFSASPQPPLRPPPPLGHHTDEVLGELGLAEAQVAWLRGQGVVA